MSAPSSTGTYHSRDTIWKRSKVVHQIRSQFDRRTKGAGLENISVSVLVKITTKEDDKISSEGVALHTVRREEGRGGAGYDHAEARLFPLSSPCPNP